MSGATSKMQVSASDLVAAWHSDRTQEEIADQFGITRRCLKNAWSELRKRRLLPDQARNNHHIVMGAVAQQNHHFDGRPCTDDTAIGEGDRLLQRLREVHGPDGRPDIAVGLAVKSALKRERIPC